MNPEVLDHLCRAPSCAWYNIFTSVVLSRLVIFIKAKPQFRLPPHTVHGWAVMQTSDLEKLILYPEKTANRVIVWIKRGTDTEGFYINNKISSAYNVILCKFLPTFNTVIKGSHLIASASGSIATANKRGDRGQPCLLPLRTTKFMDLSPVTYCTTGGPKCKRCRQTVELGNQI